VGVSKTTISRYLHGEFGFMSPQTNEKIEAVIKELGYRPNRMAQGLKATVSHMVGVTIADIGNPFSSLLLKGIQQECRACDIQLLVSDSNNHAATERASIESLLDAQVDGLIVNTTGGNDEWLRAYCADGDHKPMVMLDRIVLPVVCDCVSTDNRTAVFGMLDHLAEQGFAHVVFVTPPGEGISTRTARRQAVEEYRGEHQLECEVLVYDGSAERLAQCLGPLLARCRGEWVCLFANNDESMRDILEALPAQFRDSVGVCAFADERWAKYSGQGITCLDQDPVRMGRQAAIQLIERTYGDAGDGAVVGDGVSEPYGVTEIPARLCVHDSTRRR
jgi:LacI family kdg operon repressor